MTFDTSGHLVVTNAGPNSLSTFSLGADGTATLIDTVASGQGATCWVALAHGYLFASNAGTASVSGYLAAPNGNLTLLGATPTDPGTVDASATGQFLYVQTGGNGIVDEFQVNANGSLTQLGAVTVAGAAAAKASSPSSESHRLRAVTLGILERHRSPRDAEPSQLAGHHVRVRRVPRLEQCGSYGASGAEA